MIKKTLSFEDYNGNQVSEDFWFHLTLDDMIEMELEFDGLEKHVNAIVESKDNRQIYNLFKKILLTGYGKKSENGRRFEKDEEILKDLKFSPALDDLIVSFLNNATDAGQFLTAMLPANMMREAQKQAQNQKETQVPEIPTAPPVLEDTAQSELSQKIANLPPANVSFSNEELDILSRKDPNELTKDELIAVMQHKNQNP